MKKLSYLFLIGIFSLTGTVKAVSPDYIIAGDDVHYFKKVRYGVTSNLVGIEESGKIRFQGSEVKAYCKNGQVYEKMPVISNNMKTGQYAFMELLACRNGLKVYRHSDYNASDMAVSDEYFVFNGDQFHVSFNEKNSKTLSEFFFKR